MEKINIEQIFKDSKKLYEISSNVKMLQENLENMLTAIERNSLNYEKGKIPKEFFEPTDKKLKKESAILIKKINEMVENSLHLVDRIRSEVQPHKVVKKIKKQKGEG